jgi:hypothetical protein
VNRRENLDRFDLDDHPILDDQVGSEPDVDPNRPIDHRDWLLAHRSESTLNKFIGEDCMVNRFQQAWSQGGVDAKGGVQDLFGNGVPSHGSFL